MKADFSHLNLSERTKSQLLSFIQKPAQVLLIAGPGGSGKQAIAEGVISNLLGIETAKLVNCPHYRHITKPQDKQEISIDEVRALIKYLSLKVATASTAPVKQAVLIDGADNLSGEAQNALLKTVEEPGPSRLFVLTATSRDSVLPTIASRSRIMQLTSVPLHASRQFYLKKYSEKAIDGAWHLSSGLAGLMDALLKESSEHQLKVAVENAKRIVGEDIYQKILDFEQIIPSRDELSTTFQALSRVFSALQQNAALKNKNPKYILSSRQLIESSLKALPTNASARLIGLHASLNL